MQNNCFSYSAAVRVVAVLTGIFLCHTACLAQTAGAHKQTETTVEEVVYEGVHSIKKSELESLTGVRKGAPLNPSQNRVACQSIVNRYREKGRHFASCVLKEGDKPGDRRVVFIVEEGPEVYVRSIEFEGNQFVSGAVLKTHINSKERLLGLNLISTPYIPAVADRDVDELLKYYRSYGFSDVRVSRVVKWDPDGKTVVLGFHIHEGLRYRLQGSPTTEGDLNRSREELAPLIQAKGYDYYSEDKTKTDTKLSAEYIGYTSAPAAVQEAVYFTGPGKCAVRSLVQERPPVIFTMASFLAGQNRNWLEDGFLGFSLFITNPEQKSDR
jgi:outer membrane protein assembly factor BamA